MNENELLDEQDELNRRIAGMSAGSPEFAKVVEVPGLKTQTTQVAPKNIQSLQEMLKTVSGEIEAFPKREISPQQYESKISDIYKKYSPATVEMPEDQDKSIWRELAFALGPALIGAALGKDALGRSIGLAAGAAAGKEYAEGLVRREDKRADILKEINKRRLEMELKRSEKMADFELELQKQRAKGAIEDPALKEKLRQQTALRIELAKQGVVPGVETVTTKEKKPAETYVTAIMPGVTWNPKLPVEYQKTSDGQKMVTEARKITSQYSNLNAAIGDYKKLLNENKGVIDPTSKTGQLLELKYRDLLMKTKEAYNLGVLNGGDLEQLQAIIPISVFQMSDEGFLSRLLDLSKTKNKPAVVAEFQKMMQESMRRQLEPYGFDVNLPMTVKMPKDQAAKFKKALKSLNE